MPLLPLSALSKRIYERRALSHKGETVIADIQYGGPADAELGIPGDATDRRFFFDTHTLRQLLEVAEQSLTGRVVVHHAGLRCRQYESGGHRYEALTLIGDQPLPESFLGS